MQFEVSPDDRITRIDVVVDIEKEQPFLQLSIESAAGVIDSVQSPNRRDVSPSVMTKSVEFSETRELIGFWAFQSPSAVLGLSFVTIDTEC